MSNEKQITAEPIAIVGASALFPGSIGTQSFWNNILAGKDFMTEVPANHWLIEDYYDADQTKLGKTYATRGAFLPKVDFDPMEYGMPPNQLSSTDTAQLLALGVAKTVLQDAASVQFGKVDRSNISVILGVASATELVAQMSGKIQRPHWIKAMREAGLPESQVQQICDGIEDTYPVWNESTFPGLLGNVVAGRIANRFELGGTNCVVDAACASSLGGIAMAVQELQLGHSDLVISGGVDALNDIFMYMCFSKTPALSPTGDCRPFSDQADGTMLGEGIGMVALRRLSDAERDGDAIYALIRGIGAASDGGSKSIYAPQANGQESAIRRAYRQAGYGVDEVELIEAHGTATKAGDAAEFTGLRQAFSNQQQKHRQWCALGSVKSQIGHTKSAAGSASMIKVMMALHHKVLPPTIKVDKPNPALNIADSPFYLNTETRPWIKPAGTTRKGSISSFGFGGSNFHVTLEEYVGNGQQKLRFHNSPKELLLVAANTVEELVSEVDAIRGELRSHDLSSTARNSQQQFGIANRYRLAVMAIDIEDANSTLDMAVERIASSPDAAFSIPNKVHYGTNAETGKDIPKLGVLFPGQGSQYVNMGSEIAMEFSDAREKWDLAAAIDLDENRRLDQVVFPIPVFGDDERAVQQALLTKTSWAQPAIGCMSSSIMAVLGKLGIQPTAAAGHSYGEVSALYVAGAIVSDKDLIAISRRRGELMEEASATAGSMTAVKASVDDLKAILESCDAEVSIANINSPVQVVIAGKTEEIEKAEAQLESVKATYRRLPVATAFHTELVSQSSEPFYRYLSKLEIVAPAIPVYANATGAPYPPEPENIRRTLAAQLASPVDFQATISRMHDDGIRLFLEIGPGAQLSAMVHDCLAGRRHTAVSLDARKLDGRTALWNALGVLSINNVELDYKALWNEFALMDSRLDTCKRSPATVKLDGANFGKPYPPENGAAGRTRPNPERAETAPTLAQADTPKGPASKAAENHPVTETEIRPSAIDANWTTAFQALQQQTLEAQKAFQQTLSESHKAFLHASEVAFAQLGKLTGSASTSTATMADTSADMMLSATHQTPPAEPIVSTSIPASLANPPDSAPATAAVVPGAATVPAADSAPAQNFESLLLDIVSEKTGYPVEMLSMEMQLESDLGIDSIKRVEILSELQTQLPQLGNVDTAELAALNTLGEILSFANDSAPATAAVVPGAATVPTAGPAPAQNFESLLLDIVSEKTGYPVEMLSMEMQLESDLGIDSIKRVEILSELQTQLPQLGNVDTAELAALNTLGEILGFANGPADTAQKSLSEKATSAVDQASGPKLIRQVVACQPCPANGFALPGLTTADPVYILADDKRIADHLAALFESANIRAEVVDSLPGNARAAILLNGLNTAKANRPDDYSKFNLAAFSAIRPCSETMAESGLMFVTVQNTGGDFGLSGNAGQRVWSCGIAALAKTAALEWPTTAVKAIDIEVAKRSPRVIAGDIFQELVAGGDQLEVGIQASGARITLTTSVVDDRKDPVTLTPEDVIVVTGGARGVTAACIQELAARSPVKVAIFGRTDLAEEPAHLAAAATDAELKQLLLKQHQAAGETITPITLNTEVQSILVAREVRGNIKELQSTCAAVRYFAVDVTDPKSVRSAVERVATELGPVTGLVHGAGLLADKRIHEKTEAQFERVFRTKVDGLINLLDSLRDAPLRHLVCFSSVAARAGNPGQADYTMANEVLNRVCRMEAKRRRGECHTKAIGWGPWDGGMVSPELKRHFHSNGIDLIPVKSGADFFADEIEMKYSPDHEIIYAAGFGTSNPRPRRHEWNIWVHESQQPSIKSHIIKGEPVVPMLMASEWCLRIASSMHPDKQIRRVKNMKVLKGIVATSYSNHGNWYKITCTDPVAPNEPHFLLTDDQEVVHYEMQVELGPLGEGHAPKANASNPCFDSWTWNPRCVYDEHLFHGPDFQVISELRGISKDGCSGILQTRTPSSSPVTLYQSDVSILDGGLQLAILWERHRSGHGALPTGLKTLSVYKPAPYSDPVECVLTTTNSTPLAAEWSVIFRDSIGDVVAEMEGLEMHVLPDSPTLEKDPGATIAQKALKTAHNPL